MVNLFQDKTTTQLALMNKYIIAVLVLLIIIALIIWNSNKNKKNTVVLGQEMADASEKEKQRIEAGNFHSSPLPSFNYTKWSDEQSLIDPIENELDLKILQLCSDFKTYEADKRKEVRNSLNQNNIYTLLEFSKRTTIFGIRKKQQSYIDNGFIVIAMIDAERCDYRDLLVTLSFLNYGFERLNLVHTSIVQEAINLSDGKTKKLIEEFFKRDEKDKRIEEMAGYTAIETSRGISFIETNYEEYNPKRNLAKMLLDISNYVYSDKYQKGQVSLGKDFPSQWLSEKNDDKIEKAILAVTGTASLSTRLKDELSFHSDMQMLLIYLSEFKDDKSQQIFLEQLDKTSPTTFKRISFVQDDIFCIIIQRATMVDLEDFESQESLKRFERPFHQIIERTK